MQQDALDAVAELREGAMHASAKMDPWRGSSRTAWLRLSRLRHPPVTGRRQLMLIPEDNEVAMGLEAFEEVNQQEPGP